MVYHAEISLFDHLIMKGGYVGVDVFFVLSGYLISRILISQHIELGQIRYRQFLERRARRILPALFTVVSCTLIVAWNFLLPSEYIDLARSALAAVFFVSNFFFFESTVEYAATESLLMPLLHTWSLSIEEQFYLLFPLALIFLLKQQKGVMLTVTVVAALLSLQYSQDQTLHEAAFSFFSPISRAWELLLGSVLAQLELRFRFNRHETLSTICPLVGICLIGVSVVSFDHDTTHPGYATLVPAFGVSLVILFSTSSDFVGRLLSWKPLVGTGLISFSFYLWHFPIMAFARIGSMPESVVAKISWIGLSLILAVVTFFSIEKPARNRTQITSKLFYGIIASGALLVVSISAWIGYSESFRVFWERYAKEDIAAPYLILKDTDYSLYDRMYDNGECKFWAQENPAVNSERMKLCGNKNAKSIFIVGDSHAMNLFNIIARTDVENTVIGLAKGCRIGGCKKGDQYQYLKSKIAQGLGPNDKIIFHQSGSYLIQDAKGYAASQYAFDDLNYTINDESIRTVIEYLGEVARISRAQVYWVGPFVEYRFNPRDILALHQRNESFLHMLRINPNSIEIFGALEKYLLAQKQMDEVKYVSFSELYEVPLEALLTTEDGSCFQFKDSDHFSECGEIIAAQETSLQKLTTSFSR